MTGNNSGESFMLVYIDSDTLTSPKDFYATLSNRQWGDIYRALGPVSELHASETSYPFADRLANGSGGAIMDIAEIIKEEVIVRVLL